MWRKKLWPLEVDWPCPTCEARICPEVDPGIVLLLGCYGQALPPPSPEGSQGVVPFVGLLQPNLSLASPEGMVQCPPFQPESLSTQEELWPLEVVLALPHNCEAHHCHGG